MITSRIIPSLCGILVYKDETSSVTNNALEGNLPMIRRLLRKSLVSIVSVYFYFSLAWYVLWSWRNAK